MIRSGDGRREMHGRFERLMQGSPDAARWFLDRPREFSRAFRRYHGDVPPRAFFPAAEATLFRRWLETQPNVGNAMFDGLSPG